MPEKITRPNGSVYRPRHIRTQTLGNEDEMTGIVVFGTTDQRDARATAEVDIRAMCNEFYDHENYYQLTADLGEPVWWSRELSHFDDGHPVYSYRVDEEHGAFGLLFKLDVHADDWPDMEKARPTDVPLWTDEPTPDIVSPDCRDGKCGACTGDAWNDTTDEPAACQHACHDGKENA